MSAAVAPLARTRVCRKLPFVGGRTSRTVGLPRVISTGEGRYCSPDREQGGCGFSFSIMTGAWRRASSRSAALWAPATAGAARTATAEATTSTRLPNPAMPRVACPAEPGSGG